MFASRYSNENSSIETVQALLAHPDTIVKGNWISEPEYPSGSRIEIMVHMTKNTNIVVLPKEIRRLIFMRNELNRCDTEEKMDELASYMKITRENMNDQDLKLYISNIISSGGSHNKYSH
jgi:hypothetical protein